MFQLMVVSAVLALALGQTKYCCTPDQWEGHIGEVAGSAVNGTTHLVTGNISISYDYTNSRLASSSYLVVDDQKQENKVIMNYKTKMMYIIIGTHCTATQLPGDMTKFCVPDSAIPAGKITYGLGKESLEVMAYLIPAQTAVYVTTTVGNPCVPLGETQYGTVGQVGSVQTFGYYNISPGIKDPNVFVPPSSCTGIKHLKAAPKLSHKVMNYFLNKITKQ